MMPTTSQPTTTVDNTTLPTTDTVPSHPPSQSVAPPPSASTSSAPPLPPPPPHDDGNNPPPPEDDMLLVSEFPPPPYYYALASSSNNINGQCLLKPPDIPYRAFRVAAKKVMMERQRAREESERIRLAAEAGGAGAAGGVEGGAGDNAGDAVAAAAKTMEVLGGGGAPKRISDIVAESGNTSRDGTPIKKETPQKQQQQQQQGVKDDMMGNIMEGDEEDSIDPNNPNEPLVAIFGEIVEDPTLMVEEECEDPTVIRENVKKLNQNVVRGFLGLVQKLVNDPSDNKKIRDELSHNIFLMLQECNKFREHQAREILITTLEEQLKRRKEGLVLLKKEIASAEESLAALKQFRGKS